MAPGAPVFERMGIYIDGRVGNELAELERAGCALTAGSVYDRAQMHYLGREVLEEMASACGLVRRGEGVEGSGAPLEALPRVLDVGSGYAGDANLLVEEYECRVTALEMQAHISVAAERLTAAVGGRAAARVTHATGDVAAWEAAGGEAFDAAVSVLVLLHAPRRSETLAGVRRALKPGACFYVEDYFARNALTEEDAAALRETVACPYLPDKATYEAQLDAAGFEVVRWQDMSAVWAAFVSERKAAWEAARERHVRVHGEQLYAELTHFYVTVEKLFCGGNLGGVRLIAKAK